MNAVQFLIVKYHIKFETSLQVGKAIHLSSQGQWIKILIIYILIIITVFNYFVSHNLFKSYSQVFPHSSMPSGKSGIFQIQLKLYVFL